MFCKACGAKIHCPEERRSFVDDTDVVKLDDYCMDCFIEKTTGQISHQEPIESESGRRYVIALG